MTPDPAAGPSGSPAPSVPVRSDPVLPDGTPAEITLVDGVDIDAVHEAALACPGVAALGSGGLLGGAVTYLPGRRVTGLRVLDDTVEIEVCLQLPSSTGIARTGPTAGEVAGRIRTAVRPYVAGKRIDVVVTDVVLPGETSPDPQNRSETP